MVSSRRNTTHTFPNSFQCTRYLPVVRRIQSQVRKAITSTPALFHLPKSSPRYQPSALFTSSFYQCSFSFMKDKFRNYGYRNNSCNAYYRHPLINGYVNYVLMVHICHTRRKMWERYLFVKPRMFRDVCTELFIIP